MEHIDRMRNEKIDEYRQQLGDLSEVCEMYVYFGKHRFLALEIIERSLHRAASLSIDAGLGGAMNDGGSQDMFNSLHCWVEGLKDFVPVGRDFKNIAKQMVKEHSPDDYEEYKRLKAIFGD